MELSIIVPVYNVKDYLQRCVESVIKQDYSDYEMVLVNDGSTDGSGELCDELAERDKHIRVIHKKNGGLSSARNAGLEEAKGKYIMLLDSDDWIEVGCLQKFSELFPNNYDLIMGRAWTIDDDGNKKDKITYRIPTGLYRVSDSLADLTAGEVSFCSPFYIYRTDYVNKHSLRFLEGILHEDELWMPIALLNAETIYISDIYFYYHYIRKGSIMHSGNYQRSAESTITVCRILNEEFRKYPKESTKFLKNRLSMLYMRALPQIENPDLIIKEFGRSFPLKNCCTLRQRFKSIGFTMNPMQYCMIVKKIRRY